MAHGELVATISKSEFTKALTALEEALNECANFPNDSKTYKLIRDAAIQRFEFTVEIAWKVAAKTLGSSATSAKPVLREMLRSGLISDIDAWFDFIDCRNKSSHSYDEAIAAEVFSQIAPFVLAAKDLATRL